MGQFVVKTLFFFFLFFESRTSLVAWNSLCRQTEHSNPSLPLFPSLGPPWFHIPDAADISATSERNFFFDFYFS